MDGGVVVSIIIPSIGNRDEYLQLAINSCKSPELSVTHEIILAAGNAPPLINIANKNNIKFVLHTGKQNRAANLNTAVKSANGKYIKILDDDDIIDTKVISYLCEQAELNNADYTFTDYINIDQSGNELNRFRSVIKDTVYESVMNRGIPFSSGILRKSFIEKNGYYDEDFDIAEHYILYLKALQFDIPKFLYIDEPVAYYYRRHDGQKSNTDTLEKQNKRIEIMNMIAEKYKIS